MNYFDNVVVYLFEILMTFLILLLNQKRNKAFCVICSLLPLFLLILDIANRCLGLNVFSIWSGACYRALLIYFVLFISSLVWLFKNCPVCMKERTKTEKIVFIIRLLLSYVFSWFSIIMLFAPDNLAIVRILFFILSSLMLTVSTVYYLINKKISKIFFTLFILSIIAYLGIDQTHLIIVQESTILKLLWLCLLLFSSSIIVVHPIIVIIKHPYSKNDMKNIFLASFKLTLTMLAILITIVLFFAEIILSFFGVTIFTPKREYFKDIWGDWHWR